MIKFFKKSYLATAFTFIVMAAIETTFNAATYAYIFKVIEEKDISRLVLYIAIVIFGYIFFSIIIYLKDYWINKNIAFFNTHLKTELIKKVLEKESHAEEQTEVSSNTSFFMNELKLVEENYVKQLFNIINYSVVLITILTFSINNSFSLTIIFLSFTSISPFITRLNKSKIEKSNIKWTLKNKHFSSILRDILKGAETISSYKSEQHFIKRFYNRVTELEESNQDMNNAISLSNSIVIALSYLLMYVPIGIGMYLVIQGDLQLSSFVAVQYSSNWIVNNFLGISSSINKLNSTTEIKGAITNLLEFNQSNSTNVLTNSKIDSIVFQDVSFYYGDKTILDNVNITLQDNDNVLLEGASGSGKSTFLKLLTKKLTPNSGNIYINAQNIDDISRSELYDYISLVPQSVSIFSGTLRENITMGRDVVTEEMSKAVQDAGLEELVQQIGLEYQIGEEGSGLSGGQLKRIEIARAILFNKPILLIDEGNASLDKKTAVSINETIARLNKLVIDVEHYIPDDSLKQYTKRYYLENQTIRQV